MHQPNVTSTIASGEPSASASSSSSAEQQQQQHQIPPGLLDDNKPETPFTNALQVASAVYSDKIISSGTDLVGICFFGTREKNNDFNFPHVYLLHDLDQPYAQRVIEIENLIRNRAEFDSKIGQCADENVDSGTLLHDALWICNHTFAHVPRNVGFKRIFLFTNDDNPVRGDVAARKKCSEKAKDLNDNDVTIELFAMSPRTKFDPSLFWSHIVNVSEDEYTGRVMFDFGQSFKELKEKVRRKEFRKKTSGKFPFVLGEGVSVGVEMFNLVMKSKKPSSNFTWLRRSDNRVLKTDSKYICRDTGTELLRSDMKRSINYGSRNVVFDTQELSAIKTFDEPGMHLMGFKPRSSLKLYHNITHSSFIYPDDNNVKGSGLALSALHKKMLEMDRIAICRLIPRRGSTPHYVALIAAAETLDDDGVQVEPPGFHIIWLPFADDIRSLKIEPRAAEVKEAHTLKAKQIIKKLTIDFDSNNFENPTLQQQLSVIQAFALGRAIVDKPEDLLQPDVKGMSRHKDVISDFASTVYGTEYNPDRAFSVRTKRRRDTDDADENDGSTGVKKEEEEEDASTGGQSTGSSESFPAQKRVKKEEGAEAEEIDFVTKAKRGTLSSLTIPLLKIYLQRNRLAVSGKKSDVISRIINDLRKKKLISATEGDDAM